MQRIFYHSDHDGKLSAYWALRYYTSYKSAEGTIEFYEMDYGKVFPLGEITSEDEVWIVDYSIEPEVMKALLAKGGIVYWVDHHKSAIEKYAGFFWGPGNPIRCITSEFAASTLVWGLVHFLHQSESHNGRLTRGDITEEVVAYIRNHQGEHSRDIPWATKWVGDWDTWTHAYPESTNFISGSQLWDLHPTSDFWDSANEYPAWGRCDIEDPHGTYIHCNEFLSQTVLAAGSVINQYRENFNAGYRKSFGYEVVWSVRGSEVGDVDLKCLVLNLGRCSSLAFGDAIKKYALCISTVYVKDHWQISLYSETIDTSKIASQFLYNGSRGGGHKGASGFSCKKLPWEGLNENPSLY